MVIRLYACADDEDVARDPSPEKQVPFENFDAEFVRLTMFGRWTQTTKKSERTKSERRPTHFATHETQSALDEECT